MAAGHQQHVHRIADPAFEVTASQVAVVLHVPDLGLDGTSAFKFSLDRACHPTLLSRDEHLRLRDP